jgi:hypothetical protein
MNPNEERLIQWMKIMFALVFLSGAIFVARDINIIKTILLK